MLSAVKRVPVQLIMQCFASQVHNSSPQSLSRVQSSLGLVHTTVLWFLLTLPALRACSWDNVEELSAAAAHKKVAYQEDKVASDPLEAFCDDNPDADECRWDTRVHDCFQP